MAARCASASRSSLIDERTGKRQLIWSELDANQTARGDINLLIHPGKNLAEGHTYVVALRNLRNAGGKLIKAPAWFERLRDGRRLPRAERSQRGRYARIFAALEAGQDRARRTCTRRGTSRSPRART